MNPRFELMKLTAPVVSLTWTDRRTRRLSTHGMGAGPSDVEGSVEPA